MKTHELKIVLVDTNTEKLSHLLNGLQIIQREDLSKCSKSIVLEICDENLSKYLFCL